MTESVAAIPTIKGLDVSHYQANLDWGLVKSMGYRFAFAKATDGAHGVDNMFAIHKAGAKAAGLIFGAYHFLRFDQDIVAQATNFLKVAGGRVVGDLPHVIDVEWDKLSVKYGEGKEMDDAAAEIVFQFKDALKKALGVAPIIYTNFYFWNPGKHASAFSECLAWIPAYHTTPDKVKVPAPWEKLVLWQNSESVTLKGVTEIDENTFFGTEQDLEALTK